MSLRYSIYKVQTCSQLLAEACLSYHTQFHLSRTFFKFFQISLSRFDSVVCCHLAATRASYHIDFHLSTTFFKFFKFLFDSILFPVPRGQLAYISTSFSFCQASFYIISDFFHLPDQGEDHGLFRCSFFCAEFLCRLATVSDNIHQGTGGSPAAAPALPLLPQFPTL